MVGAWRLYGRTAFLVLVVLYAVGMAGHSLEASLPLMKALTPWFLLLSGSLVMASSLAAGGRRFAGWAAGTYAFTFLAEAAGVATGAVFGEYAYGRTLGLAWHGVPLVIAFNWVLVVHGAFCVARRVVPRRWGGLQRPLYLVLAGLIAMGFDVLLEPVAIRLDYWAWAGGEIPLQNYAAWFGIALAAAAVHPREKDGRRDMGSSGRLAAAYVGIQALFFLALQWVWHAAGG